MLDSQFEKDMGSAYLLAHGLGRPVENATSSFEIPEAGAYAVWVRAKDWVPTYHPGAFLVAVDGNELPTALGADDEDWHWARAGLLDLDQGKHTISLIDQTGFDGRCDAIFIAPANIEPSERGLEVDRAWRRSLLGIPNEIVDKGNFDVVVVGCGVPAASAALAAAKTGSKVALMGDRPVLGGNASSEVGLMPRGHKTPFVESLIKRNEDGSLGCEALVETEENITCFFNTRCFSCNMDEQEKRIISVCGRNLITGEEMRVSAPYFIDATGRGVLAKLSGADIRTGREGKEEFGESLAPDVPDALHHGHTPLFHVGLADKPFDFPDVPWAKDVSKDFACLAGQMGNLSEDNQPGPCAGEPETPEEARAKGEEAQQKLLAGVKENNMMPPKEVIHLFPGTHFWEYGQFLDLDEPGNEELIRDHLLRALYGTMANIKAAMPEKYANLHFEWLHHVPATGEYCRIMGDTIVNENDVRNHTHFDDVVVYNDDPFCLHYPGDETYDFRLGSWVYDLRDGKPYEIPFSSLYSQNIDNLMMAGKQISVSRVVGSSTKVMANGAQQNF